MRSSADTVQVTSPSRMPSKTDSGGGAGQAFGASDVVGGEQPGAMKYN
ncbi:hypothetical protein ACWEQC_14085 [Streptomyces shenzhenensis]